MTVKSRRALVDAPLDPLGAGYGDPRQAWPSATEEPYLGCFDQNQVNHDHAEQSQEEPRRKDREAEKLREAGVGQQRSGQCCARWHDEHCDAGLNRVLSMSWN